jgi:hypothetical protein
MFREGRELMEANKVSEACGKFAESYRLDRALGTLINLALCHEKEGKTASAWAEFNEAAADAAAEHDDREAFARKHIAALAPELPRLSLTVAPAASALSSLEIKLDGHVVGKAAWSSSLPIDPGDHELRASADGKRPYLTNFSVKKGAGTTSVAVPAFDDAPKAVNLTPAPPEPPPPASTQRTIGYIATGAGAIGLLAGAAFGLTAISAKGDRDARCDANNLCDQEGLDKDKDARNAATVSTIGFIAGGVLTAGGLFLIFTSPKAPKAAPPPTAQAKIGVAGTSVFIGGRF